MQNKQQPTLRVATVEDFKVGTVLIDSEGFTHAISEKSHDGIWNTRRSNFVMECEAKFYKVKA